MAQQMAVRIIGQVGQGELFPAWGEVAFHLRRQLSDEEMRFLSPEWLALPAIDLAGPE